MALADLLKTQATLERGTPARQGTGDIATTWAPFSTEMVNVRPARVGVDISPAQAESVTHIILSRYLSTVAADPKAKWRFVIGENIYMLAEAHDPAGRYHHHEHRVRRMQ